MTIKITGVRGSNYKSVEVDVIRTYDHGYTVRHTDGKIAFIGTGGGEYSRMHGPKYISLMKDCTVEITSYSESEVEHTDRMEHIDCNDFGFSI